MLKSMTAFGRSVKSNKHARMQIEIQSVNRRYLEVFPSLPKELSSCDPELRKLVSQYCSRGKVAVRVDAYYGEESPVQIEPNLDLVRQLKHAWTEIGKELGCELSPQEIAGFIANESSILQAEAKELDSYAKLFAETLNEALAQLDQMKRAEGATLEKDISERLTLITETIEKIAEKAPAASDLYREKLKKRLEEILQEVPDAVERDVAIFAEKVDITEEIIRFRSHMKQFHALLLAEDKAVGKTLDFLLQELNREINTIGSKSSDVEVSGWVISVKSELERIREQVQNIE